MVRVRLNPFFSSWWKYYWDFVESHPRHTCSSTFIMLAKQIKKSNFLFLSFSLSFFLCFCLYFFFFCLFFSFFIFLFLPSFLSVFPLEVFVYLPVTSCHFLSISFFSFFLFLCLCFSWTYPNETRAQLVCAKI